MTTVTVNTGGFDEPELAAIRERALALGAVDHVVIDGRRRLYEQFVSYIVKANYLRNGVYPSCVGVERMLQAEEVTQVALARGAAAIVHGSTGATTTSASTRSSARSRRALRSSRRSATSATRASRSATTCARTASRCRTSPRSTRSTSASSARRSAARRRIGSWEYLPDEAWPRTRSVAQAPEHPQELTITFQEGLPVAVALIPAVQLGLEPAAAQAASSAGNGATAAALEAAAAARGTTRAGAAPAATAARTTRSAGRLRRAARLNALGGEHGVGRGIHTGQTIMGIMGRLGFEAPGMLILIAAHRELSGLVLTKTQQTVKASLGALYGDMLHEGLYYDPVLDDIRALLDSSQVRVGGEVRVRLHKGTATMLGCSSPHSLLDGSRRLGSTYGYGSSLWTGEDARAFAHVYAIAGRLARASAEV